MIRFGGGRKGIVRLLAATAGAVCAFSSLPSGQTATAPELKAAFLYNFAKFVEWPSESMPPGAPLIVCVLGDGAVADAVAETVKGRAIDGHQLTARRVKADSSLRTCHVLYVSGMDEKHAHKLIEGLGGSTVLTASDFDRFAQMGGVATLFIENGKMRFAVNIESAQRARLQVSSKLLGLAKIVRDEPHGQR